MFEKTKPFSNDKDELFYLRYWGHTKKEKFVSGGQPDECTFFCSQ